MIWLDIIDPKYVLFFEKFLPLLKSLDKILITTRQSKDYNECVKLLDLFNIEYICLGGYGGESKLSKLQARLDREKEFLKLFDKLNEIPKIFITGASVEGVHTAYGLGIPVINFSDTPIKGDYFDLSLITILSRLTLPLSSLVFRPFVVPEICYTALGLEPKNIISYDFIDIALWLKDLRPAEDFRLKYSLNPSLPTILLREEEYKAHYVSTKLPIIYESIKLLSDNINANLVIMPRYESDYLHRDFGHLKNVYIIEDKVLPKDFYPFVDILIGGGGTMNLESCYLGIPTISTRSLLLFHDRYLLNNDLMKHCLDSNEVLEEVKNILNIKWNGKTVTRSNNQKYFELENASFDGIFQIIKNRFYE